MEHTEQEMLEKLLTGFGRIDERFNRIDEKFARIDERFNQIDEKFARIDERLDQIDERLTRFETKVEKRFNQFDQRLIRVEGRLESVASHTTQLIKDVANVNATMHNVNEDVHGIKKYMEHRETEQAVLDKRLNSHKWQLADLREDVDVLQQSQQ